jgi:hypothetical protein
MVRGLLLAAFAALTLLHSPAAEAVATVTILEGDALVYRGAGRVRALEGVRLAPGDIVETGESAFAQIEFADQSVLDLGGATRVLIQHATTRQKSERYLYLMNGWAKLAGVKREGAAAAGYDLRAPLFEIPANAGVVVVRATPAEVTIFCERGNVRVSERGGGATSGSVTLKSSESYQRKAGSRGAASPGVPQSFVADMPKFFRDTLPSRADRFRDKEVRPTEAPDPAYADVEVWLKAEAPLRRSLMARWRAKVREPAFRAALIANLSAHPEWDPILFPEKYLPKDPPTSRSGAASAVTSSQTR